MVGVCGHEISVERAPQTVEGVAVAVAAVVLNVSCDELESEKKIFWRYSHVTVNGVRGRKLPSYAR